MDEATVLAQAVDDVLMRDDEIRAGAAKARVELEDLKSAFQLHKEEVLDSCRVERNRFEEYSKELSKLEDISASLTSRYYPPRLVRMSRDAFWAILTLLALGCIVLGLTIIFHWPMSFTSFRHTFGLILLSSLAGGTCVIGLLYLILKRFNKRKAELIVSSSQFQLLKRQKDAAEATWREAIHEKGVKSFFREEINRQKPSYSTTLDIDRNKVAGLAEIRDPLYYIGTSAQARVDRLLESMPGGSLGISGPRGAGKTTLLRRYCAPELQSREEEGASFRVLVSAPVVYDAREFILYLFASLCQAIIASSDRPWKYELSSPRSISGPDRIDVTSRLIVGWLFLILPIAAIWGFVLLLSVIFNWKLNAGLQPAIILLAVGLTGSFVAYSFQRYEIRRSRMRYQSVHRGEPQEDDVFSAAATLLFGLAYQQSFSKGWSGGVKLPVGAEFGVSSNMTMTEKPMGFPEIVGRFNSFLDLAAKDGRKVYIGIDELDKIDSEEKVYQFLNDIKAIFGLERCYYLVSISQNAMSAFERRGLPLRDAFDSAFDAVVDVGYLDAVGARRLLQRRVIGMPMAYLDFCYAVSGGLPRDLIRIARDLVFLTGLDKSERQLTKLVTQMIGSDVARKREAAMVSVQEIDLEPDTGDVLSDLNDFDASKTACDKLLEASRRLLSSAAALNGSRIALDEKQPDAVQERRQRINRVRIEMSTYYYYASTLLAFFSDSLSSSSLKQAEKDSGPAGICQLAKARQAFSVNPRLAWTIVSSFRQVWNLDAIEYPGARTGGGAA